MLVVTILTFIFSIIFVGVGSVSVSYGEWFPLVHSVHLWYPVCWACVLSYAAPVSVLLAFSYVTVRILKLLTMGLSMDFQAKLLRPRSPAIASLSARSPLTFWDVLANRYPPRRCRHISSYRLRLVSFLLASSSSPHPSWDAVAPLEKRI